MSYSDRKVSGKKSDTHVKGTPAKKGMDTAVKQLAADVRELRKEVRQLKRLIEPELVLTKKERDALAAAENDLRKGRVRFL